MGCNFNKSRPSTWLVMLLASITVAHAQDIPAQDAAPAAAAEEAHFDIAEYRVLGNTVLPAMDIETVLYEHLGEMRTLADVELARQALEKLYKDRGYGTVYVDIPDQSVDGGIIRLKVTEGRVDRIRISGARYFSNGRIRQSLPALKSGEVLNFPALQAQLGNVTQQSADRSVTPVLKAGRSPGTVDVELKVQDALPFHASIELNDRYSANTSRTRASINLSYGNLFQKFHSLSLQYQTTPQDLSETQVLAATYLAPFESGNLLAVYAVDTNSDFAVVSTGGDLSVLGSGNIYGARYIIKLPLMEQYTHSVTLGVDYKDFVDNIVLTDGTRDTSPISYLSWSAAYGGNQLRERSATNFNLGVNFGVRDVVNDTRQFEYKRYEGRGNYFYLRGDASHTQSLWRDAVVFFRLTGQWAPDPLISNEQFAVGGVDSVRGYLESAQLGDSGIAATLELRTPSLHARLGEWAQQFMMFAFYDTARLRQISQNINDGVATDAHATLASAGLGVRFMGFHGVEAAFDGAYALRPSGTVEKGDLRLHFKVKYGF